MTIHPKILQKGIGVENANEHLTFTGKYGSWNQWTWDWDSGNWGVHSAKVNFKRNMGFPQTNMGEQPRKTSRELFDRFCNQVSSVQTPVDRSLDSGYTIDKGLFLVVRKNLSNKWGYSWQTMAGWWWWGMMNCTTQYIGDNHNPLWEILSNNQYKGISFPVWKAARNSGFHRQTPALQLISWWAQLHHGTTRWLQIEVMIANG